jgi:hypothetical protein
MIAFLESTEPLLVSINRGLMVDWINRDLIGRASHDVRHSIVLYDDAKMFVAALPASVDMTADVLDALATAGVCFYSKGIV